MSDLTVLTPTFNRAKVIEQTLKALCQVLSENIDAEIVVINNASTDATAEVLAKYSRLLPLTVLWESEPGKCNALNRALDDLDLGDVVLFTDDDVTPDPNWLCSILDACKRHTKYNVFGGRIVPGWPPEVPVPFWASTL